MENSTVTLEEFVSFLYQIEYSFTIQTGNPTLRYLAKLESKLCSLTLNLYVNSEKKKKSPNICHPENE